MLERKVKPEHLERKAYIYIRQSTLRQVIENSESTERQYHLKDRALSMGWDPERINIIDEDLGLSGRSSKWRNGFQHLMTEVSMAKAGAIFALEISRFARSSSDWHRLLEICAMTETLIVDEDGIYDPHHFNDRLLLGMKGQMSEAELHMIQARLQGGTLNKARRGALQLRLPIGLVYNLEGKITLDPDKEVQAALKRLFNVFTQKGSAGKVVRYFSENELLFPQRILKGVNKGNIFWRPLTHSRILQILHNPRYTGTYVFGRMRVRKNPITGKMTSTQLPHEKWQVFIPEHGEGYLSWHEYEVNQRRLRANAIAFGADKKSGPPREGPALLQGIVICGKCGTRMTVRYHDRKKGLVADYVCQRDGIEHNRKHCQVVPGGNLDKTIGKLLVEKLTPESIEVALNVFEEVKAQRENIKKAYQMRLAKLQYEAELAQKQYMHVDPVNRLVAGTLEKNWNDKLLQLQIARDEYERKHKNNNLSIIPEIREKLLQLIKDFPKVWYNPKTPLREKKRIVRLMIKDVTLNKDEVITLKIFWQGGAHTVMEIPIPLPAPLERKTTEKTLKRIRELSLHFTSRQMVKILNQEGYTTGTKQKFNTRRLDRIKSIYGIKSYYSHLREKGKLTVKEMAEKLKVSTGTVINWHKAGLIKGYRVNDRGECLYEAPGGRRLIKKQGVKLEKRKKIIENSINVLNEV